MRKFLRTMRAFLYAFMASCLVLGGIVPAGAATVGQLTGEVTDGKTHAPISGVRVIAVAPTGRGTTITDDHGHYTILGLVPDTYTISFEVQRYETRAIPGVTVVADDTATQDAMLSRTITTIGNVNARSRSSAFQPNQSHEEYTITSKEVVEAQGTALNSSATQLFATLPGVTNAGQNNGVPVIRAGRANEIGVSINGVPVTNPYSGTFGAAQQQDFRFNFDVLDTVPTLAIQDLTLTPGVADASYGATGTGNFNIVFKKGTYPGFSDFIGGVGGGHFYHGVSGDYGIATPDGRWNAYAMFHGDDLYQNWGPGYTSQVDGTLGFPGLQTSRQFVGNVGYNFGKNYKYGLDLQGYADVATLAADFGYNNNQICFYSCTGSVLSGGGDCTYTGLDNIATAPIDKISGYPDQPKCWGLLPLYPGQTKYVESLGEAGIPQRSEDFPHYNYSLDFHANVSPSTFMTTRFFRAGGYETDNAANGGATSYFFQKGGVTTGGTMDFNTQIGSKHLLKYGGLFSQESPEVNQDLPDWGLEIVEYGALTELYDFVPKNYGDNINGNQGCPYNAYLKQAGFTGFANYCGYLENTTGAPLVQIAGKSLVTNIQPHFASGYITDDWRPTSALTIDAGVRLDTAKYNYPAVGVDPATCTSLYGALTVTPPKDAAGNYISIVPGKSCPTETFASIGDAVAPKILEPRFGAILKLGHSDAIRASFGRSISYVPESIINPQTVDPNSYSNLANVPAYFNPAEYCLGFTGVSAANDPRCLPANFNTAFAPGTSVGFYSAYNPFPCAGTVKAYKGRQACYNGNTVTNANYPLPPPGQPNPSGAPACGIPPALVPCLSYQEQMIWEYQNDFGGFGPYLNGKSGVLSPVPPAQFSNFSLGYTREFTDGIGHGVLQSLTQGTGMSFTAWKRVGMGLQLTQSIPIINPTGTLEHGPGNAIYAYPDQQTANGLDLANGLEARISRSRNYGLSLQFSATYQHALTNVYSDPGNEYNGLNGGYANGSSHAGSGTALQVLTGPGAASNILGLLYNTPYVSPLTTNTTVSFRTRSGFRVGTNIAWSKGFPIGAGLYTPQFIGGEPFLIPNTNAVNGTSASLYVDPTNPGSLRSPNIAATNGISEGRYAWTKLSPAQSIPSLQVEYEISRKATIGVNVSNLFDKTGSGAELNTNYQPVASGIAGPKSGTGQTVTASDSFITLLGGQAAYINIPNNEGRTFYLYLDLKNF